MVLLLPLAIVVVVIKSSNGTKVKSSNSGTHGSINRSDNNCSNNSSKLRLLTGIAMLVY